MKLLAYDLVWDGYTGWVYYNDDLDDPFVRYGEFKPKAHHKATGVLRQQQLCQSLYGLVREVTDAFKEKGLIVVFEQSDWHQELGTRGDWKKVYARERTVQRTLGMAEAAFMLAVNNLDLPLIGIGAAEAKREFGAVRKDAAARLLVAEYSDRFSIKELGYTPQGHKKDVLFGSSKDGFFVMVDGKLNQQVPHHVSDAMVVAKVVGARLRLNELAD